MEAKRLKSSILTRPSELMSVLPRLVVCPNLLDMSEKSSILMAPSWLTSSGGLIGGGGGGGGVVGLLTLRVTVALFALLPAASRARATTVWLPFPRLSPVVLRLKL